MRDVIFHRLAETEYLNGIHWYSERSGDASRRFREEVDLAINRIRAQNDTAFPSAGGAFRYVRVRRYPFTLIFRPRSPELTEVVAVAHTSRRPGYWRRR